jgi:hypothetical protein
MTTIVLSVVASIAFTANAASSAGVIDPIQAGHACQHRIAQVAQADNFGVSAVATGGKTSRYSVTGHALRDGKPVTFACFVEGDGTVKGYSALDTKTGHVIVATRY